MMTLTQLILLIAALAMVALAATLTWQIRRRNLQNWVAGYLWQSARRYIGRRRRGNVVDVLLCIADHFEPACGGASDATADARVEAWIREYPRLFGSFRDSDDRPPRHTFFYPIDQYQPRHVDALAYLCRQGFGEVEIHLHHDHDTAENLDRMLRRFTQLFADRHGLLGRHADGRIAYGFVHGNWALDNARPDGRWCGVRNELDVLRRTGCYADFTLPSAPDATQTQKINSIYYAVGNPNRSKSHSRGIDVGTASPPPNGLMLIQGPLRLWWPGASWMPRIENGCIQRGQPPTMKRLDQWIGANVHVRTRPDWLFLKLHTHGATEANQRVVLGKEMAEFHRSLARRAADDRRFRFHYVTAREMYNVAKAAEAGWTGPVTEARDFVIAPPASHNRDSSTSSPEKSKKPLLTASFNR
jgi:hypothetical protein